MPVPTTRRPPARRASPERRRATLAAALCCALWGCSSPPAPSDGSAGDTAAPNDAVIPQDGSVPMGIDAILQMCRMNNACGYQTRFQLPADLCAQRALDLLASGTETDSPEHRLHFARMVQCAQTATTCDAYVRCADFDTACSGMAQPTCAGNVAVRCSTPGGNHLPRIFDCAAAGGTCANGECVYPQAMGACTTNGGAACDGNTRTWCRPTTGGALATVREACPAGTTCMASGTDAACYRIGACTAAATRCDGDTAVSCLPMGGGFAELRSDCAAVNRRCEVGARDPAVCVPRGTECVSAGARMPTTSMCDGAAVTVCLEGTRQRLECAPLGRTMCTMASAPLVGTFCQ